MKIKMITICSVLMIALVLWTVWGNTALELNTYTVSGERVPDGFDGYRIAQISDLHNTEMGEGNEKLLKVLRDANPDMIVITGDVVDSRRTNVNVAVTFAEEAVKIAPCYYVTGNHEGRIPELDVLLEGLENAKVSILNDEAVTIEDGEDELKLIGVNDPSFQTDYLFGDDQAVMDSQLENLMVQNDTYSILLSHRPELFGIYVEKGVDLVFSGHAHGGQFRLPLIGGLVAPNQGVFPKYDGGVYTAENTSMVVSRGIGNSIIPLRFNNRPEVVLVELKAN